MMTKQYKQFCVVFRLSFKLKHTKLIVHHLVYGVTKEIVLIENIKTEVIK